MAGNIKGITIEFRGDTTKLDKALRQINNETRKIDKELKNVDKALKFNPTSVELWRQKQQLLTQKVAETREKLTLLKNEQARMDAAGVDKNSEEYRKLQREIIETSSKCKKFESDLRKIGSVKLKAASEQIKQIGSNLENAGQKMMGLSMAAGAVVVAMGAITVKSGQWADDINTMSAKYGIATEQLQRYAAAADLVDVSVETIAGAHTKLTKSISAAANGSKTQAAAFDKLGVSYLNADGTMRDSEDVFNDVIGALGKMENETERDAIAMQLMGKSAANLNPLIEDGGETYKRVSETMSKYGLDIIDQETLDSANEFNNSLDTIKAIGLVTFQQIGTTLASTLAPVLEKVVDLIGRLAQWLTNLDPQVLTIIGVIASVIAVLAPVLIVLGKLATGISAIINLVGIIGPAIGGVAAAFGPVLLIIAAVIAIGIILYKNWDKIKAKAIEIKDKVVAAWNALKAKVTSIFNAIKSVILAVWTAIKVAIQTRVNLIKTVVTTVFNTIKRTVTTIWNGIKQAITHPIQTAVNLVRNAINTIKRIINGAHLKLPKFKLPHFKISAGSLPWGIGGKGTPPKIAVDWYAKGGIFDSASLIGVGEKGSEAVVPLDKFWDKMDKIAEGTGTQITINVYGSDGMSVSELAAAVEARLIAATKNRRLAWQ